MFKKEFKPAKIKKHCLVCGDRALCFNFNGLSCESCKLFFRRNAFKNLPNCRIQGQCPVTVETRNWCKKCRLDKCLAIGMEKELLFRYADKWKNKELSQSSQPKVTKKDNFDVISSSSSSSSYQEEPLNLVINKLK